MALQEPISQPTSDAPHTRGGVQQAVENVLWWPSALALVVLGLAYSLVSERLTLGPPRLVLGTVVIALALLYLLRWRGLHTLRRLVAFAIMVILTLAVPVSAVFLLVSSSVADFSRSSCYDDYRGEVRLDPAQENLLRQWLGTVADLSWELRAQGRRYEEARMGIDPFASPAAKQRQIAALQSRGPEEPAGGLASAATELLSIKFRMRAPVGPAAGQDACR